VREDYDDAFRLLRLEHDLLVTSPKVAETIAILSF